MLNICTDYVAIIVKRGRLPLFTMVAMVNIYIYYIQLEIALYIQSNNQSWTLLPRKVINYNYETKNVINYNYNYIKK